MFRRCGWVDCMSKFADRAVASRPSPRHRRLRYEKVASAFPAFTIATIVVGGSSDSKVKENRANFGSGDAFRSVSLFSMAGRVSRGRCR